MSRNLCIIRASRVFRSAYFVWALLAASYIVFEAFDIDGSNLTRMLGPWQRAALAAEALSDAAADPHELSDHREHWTTISVHAAPDVRLRRQFEHVHSALRVFYRARLHRSGSPRDSLADSFPDH